jgi:tryptophan synthase alpha chain
MSTRIDRRFAALQANGEKGFIAYVTAGDPNLKATEDIVLRLGEVGVDIVELGIPFSDPLADGPVNQASAARALEAGTTLEGVLGMVQRIRRHSDIPIMCYTYMNPIHARGAAGVLRDAAEAGVDGMLFLDLPVEESGPYVEWMRKYNVNNITLVTPTTPPARIARIVAKASGFVYCVSREGVTGAQKSLGSAALDLVARTKELTPLPVALGFGISSPEHAKAAARAADAVVVGSAIVNRFHEAPATSAGRLAAAAWVGRMVAAVKEA